MDMISFIIYLLVSLLANETTMAALDNPMQFMKTLAEFPLNDGGINEEDTDEYKRFTEEFGKDTANRPTKCQVCRVLAQELAIELNRTSEVKKEYFATSRIDGQEVRVNEREQKKKIDYNKSELRLMDILEKVCKNVHEYRVHAGPPFPYLKGVKSVLKQVLEELSGGTGLPMKTKSPDESINDPTHEMKRMFYKCTNMIEEYEDEITDWYMNHQKEDPVNFLCEKHVLKKQDIGCLYASTEFPKGFAKPKKEKGDDKKKKIRHFEL